MKKRNLIVFDIDGTLTDTMALHQKALADSLFELGIKEINTEFHHFKYFTDSYIVKEIFENDTGETFTEEILSDFERRVFEKVSIGVFCSFINK